jgi:class 3 adenylate cyclase/tetratricopeptide (TPR) repeat protein
MATVLFADLVGFTTFSESADPEHVKDLVDRCFEALSSDVTAYGGQVDKILGDALVALFGAPVAHEDDAERAVRCALQMQRTLARVRDDHGLAAEMRIGVNTGEVLVGALRGGGDYTAMGDVVNIASRLQTAADPGRVVVGPSTYAATRLAVRYDSLGALVVKGREEPVEAWTAVEALARPGKRRRARTPLVGRDPEVGLLRGIVDAALVRQRAHLVLLTGDAGVGKSRLAGEVARHATDERDALVLRGECVPYGEDVWWPVAETIRGACQLSPDASLEEARENLCGHVAFAIGRASDDAEVKRIARGLLYLLGFAEEFHDVDPTRARDDALRSAQGLYSYLARKRPLVIVLSDLHWADELVLGLVDRMLEWLRGLPFVLVATARPELKDRWRPEPGRHDLTVLNLEPLDAKAVATLVDELLGDAATPELVSLLHERSGGNPFFVEELAALIRESGPATGALQAGRLPATLQGLVSARLDALPPGARTVLEDCAVVGASGSVDAVRALAATNAAAIDADVVLNDLSDRELIDIDGDEFRFPSEVVRDVAYGTLTKAERARRHAALADWLAKRMGKDDSAAANERVAHHFGAAAELLGEIGSISGIDGALPARALGALERAADRARGAEVWKSAARLYDQALSIMPADTPDETRWRLLLGRARAQAEQRELVDARRDVEEVLEEASSDGRTTARALTLMAEIEQMQGHGDDSISTFERALAMWRSIGDEQGVADALRGRGITAMFIGDLDGADDYFSEALEVFRRIDDKRGEAWAVQNLATISFFRGQPQKAEQRLAAAGEMFHDLGDWGGLNWSFALLAWVRFMQGRLDEAEAIALEQLPEADANGARWVSGILGVLLANISLWSGRTQTAVMRAKEALAKFSAIGDAWGGAQARSVLVRALGAIGRVEDAIHEINLMDDLEGPGGNVALRDVVRAQLLVHVGDRDALPSALHLGTHDDYYTLDAERRMVLGLALLQAGRLAEAVAELETAREQIEDPAAGAGAATAAALALAYVTVGRTAEARVLADDGRERGTYLDQLQSATAGAFAQLQAGDATTAEAFDALVAQADATESTLDQASVRLARARAWRALDRSDAPEAESDAQSRMATMGVDLHGWDRVFTRAARGDRA